MTRKLSGFVTTWIATLALSAPAGAAGGVTEINQQAVADAGGFPYVISASGSYRVTSNLTLASSSADAIQVSPSVTDVEIDLNGFAILCTACPGGNTGILADTTTESVVVRDGTVRGFGVAMTLRGTNTRIEQVRALDCATGFGLRAGRDAIVTRSSVQGCFTGARLGVGGVFREVVVTGTLSNGGLFADHATQIRDNVFNGGAGPGITAARRSTVTGNVSNGNGVHGIRGIDNVVRSNVANDNTEYGISVDSGTVLENVMDGNTLEGLFSPANEPIGYSRNLLTANNGGNANPQVSGGLQMDSNACGGDLSCP